MSRCRCVALHESCRQGALQAAAAQVPSTSTCAALPPAHPRPTRLQLSGRSPPVLLALPARYSVCHWCHVMERESFESQEVAQLMNANFVNVKVDREERPDVDKVSG